MIKSKVNIICLTLLLAFVPHLEQIKRNPVQHIRYDKLNHMKTYYRVDPNKLGINRGGQAYEAREIED